MHKLYLTPKERVIIVLIIMIMNSILSLAVIDGNSEVEEINCNMSCWGLTLEGLAEGIGEGGVALMLLLLQSTGSRTLAPRHQL